ncbi:MAG: hypothetical protein R8G34_14790 [Paracoccaceae bacterium]|nr:hypothetical protein [Paracoccaceae bacterium]
MKWITIYVLTVALSLVLALTFSLRYSQATLFFGALALLLAYPVMHRIPQLNLTMGLFAGLVVVASFPFRKFFQLDDFLPSTIVMCVYAGILFVAGLGWKRSWK